MTIRNRIQQLIRTGFLHIFGSSVINRIITFLSSVVLVRILTKEEYGTFTYAWNIYSILLLFNGFGMESGVLQVCSEHSGDEKYCRQICGYGLRCGMIFDLLLMAVLLGLGLWMPMQIENADTLLCMLCLLPMVQFLYYISTSFLRSQKRNRDYMHLTVLHTVLMFVATVLGAPFLKEKGVVLGYYIAFLSAALYAWFVKRLRWAPGSALDRNERKALLSIAFVSMCNNGLSQLLYLLDIFVLGLIDPQETILASYKVATTIPTALVFIPNALVTYLYPYFAEHRGDGEWCLKRYKQVLLGLGAVNAVISLGLVILAPWIIQIVFGQMYLDAVPVFRILAINYFFSGTFSILSGNLLVTQRKLKFNLMVALISGGVNIIADFLFIRWWGSVGAALATVLVVMVTSVLSTTYLIYTFKKSKKKRRRPDMVNVIGLGYIGLPTALMLASHGVEVVGTDYSKELVSTLNAGQITFKEDGLFELFQDAVNAGIQFTTEYQTTDTYIISVPTPYDKFSKKVDPCYVISAVKSVMAVCQKGATVIVESTVSPGTIDKHIRPVIEANGFAIGQDIHLVHAPERIIPGNMIRELLHNNRTIGADSQKIGEKVKNLYSSFCQGEIVVTDIRTAEMTKVVENTFRAVNIAFANELAKICRHDNMDVYEIIRICNMHPRVNILQPGPGVGGHCISVDPWFLVGDYPSLAKVIDESMKTNDSMPDFVLNRIYEIMAENNITDLKRVGLYGLTYKENVDDCRESPTLQLLESQKRHLAEPLRVYDPLIAEDIVTNQHHDLDDFLANVDMVILMVGHDEIKANMDKLQGKIVLDTRNVCPLPGVYRL